ncbi:hypothetical protein [Bdellovibrio svalbardensis]|uniref:Uncharacterized protein n=1 Tax=Bdellovibrio svalbardensis TaxID=2972972 RepID=A0ABT6DMR2_9BACT|nr:hypothetical protein [Bdellovibrio svalbardensis]MDG0817385.1 hypothetical protein [Bdellovibrio svalbardensis]
MKSVVFTLVMLFSAISFADERVFDCTATALSRNSERPEDTNIDKNPNIIFRQGLKQWSLQVGDLLLNTRDAKGPALAMEAGAATATLVRYDFWVEASYEYEFVVSVKDHSAKLFWWGLGERVHVGNFQCEVIEQ